MRHNKSINHLGRTSSHRKAMLSNMSSSLIMHKRITTTVAKAKALKKYVEPLITKAKNDTTHSRRIVFSCLEDKTAVAELFREVVVKVGDRPGGYTRILRTGSRLGDNAEMCIIELVDYNAAMLEAKDSKKKASRRSRRSKTTSNQASETAVDTKEIVEDVVDAVEKTEKTVQDKVEEVVENVIDVVETVEEKIEEIAEAVENVANEVENTDEAEEDKNKDGK
ncbi:MAG: 50S ribosomal protein L17 [Bacteroidales bacterium]|nr:50S ribosomal protein L17 [Bacteroidales bacterium]